MLTPAYKVTIGKKTVDSIKEPKGSTIVHLVVSLNMEESADSFTVTLAQVGGVLKPALRDKATVELGYADEGVLTQVMAGSVTSVEPSIDTLTIVGYSGAETLLRFYLDQTYENQTAGAVVRDLAKKSGVNVANAEDGITFPAYVIDGRRSCGRHVRDLADLCGFDSYFDPEGKLVFQSFAQPKAVHIFEHSKDILELQVARVPPSAGVVQAWGESPASIKGPGSAAWLTKNFSRSEGTAGSGKPVLLLERPSLRTREAAKAAAIAEETRIRRISLQGILTSPGRPEVKLGDSVQLRAVPDGSLNKTFQVRAVTHRITKGGGFTTEVGFRSI